MMGGWVTAAVGELNAGTLDLGAKGRRTAYLQGWVSESIPQIDTGVALFAS